MPSTPLLSADELAARSQRALTVATDAGRELGLTVDSPAILHDEFSVVVHLAPAPVVVRIPVVLPYGYELSSLTTRQTRELAAVAWLADRGEPVVPPSPLVPRMPVVREGLSMTFWERVEEEDRQPDFAARGPLVASLHRALRDYPSPLQFLLPLSMSVSNGLGFLEHHADLIAAEDLDRAKREWQVLAPLVMSRGSFASAFPGVTTQPLHGDSPGYNMIETKRGLLHTDFEDVTLGPVEWDLTMQPESAMATYDEAGLRAGQRRVDPDVLRIMSVLRMLQVVACHSLIPKLPSLSKPLADSLVAWRQMPFAGGYQSAG